MDVEESLGNFRFISPKQRAELASGPTGVKREWKEETVDRQAVDALRARIEAGEELDAPTLRHIVLNGRKEQRIALRGLLASDAVSARNQDLLLGVLKGALEGDQQKRKEYEGNRITIEENFPPWARAGWLEERNAPWRRLNLHGERVTRYCQKFFAKLFMSDMPDMSRYERKSVRLPREKICYVRPQYKEIHVLPLSEVSNRYDQRLGLLTFGLANSVLEAQQRSLHELKQFITAEVKLALMKREVEQGEVILASPTVVGEFVREVAVKELTYRLAAHLLEDACLLYGWPLTPEAKKQLWLETRSNPWSIAECNLFKYGSELATLLSKSEPNPEGVQRRFSELIFDEGAIVHLLHPEYFVDLSKAGVSTAAPVPSSDAGRNPPAEAPALSSRLVIQAALDEYGYGETPPKRHARVLAKLINADPELLDRTMQVISSRGDLDEYIQSLRSVRRGEPKRRPDAADPAGKADETALQIEAESAFEPAGPRWDVIYSPEVLKLLRDGPLRHRVVDAVDAFVEEPRLGHKSKVAGTDDVWQLRVTRHNLGICYFQPGGDRLVILDVVKLSEGELNRDRLQSLRDREKGRLQA